MCHSYIQFAILRQHFNCWHNVTVDPGLWHSPLLSSGIIAVDLQLFPTMYIVCATSVTTDEEHYSHENSCKWTY